MRANRGTPQDRARDKAAALEAERKLGNVRFIMGSTAGREVLCDIIESGGVFTPVRGDLHDSGRLALALALLNTVRIADPQGVGLMLAEREGRALRDAMAAGSEQPDGG